MFAWLGRLFGNHEPQHEPDVAESQQEQRRHFRDLDQALAEVSRVEALAEGRRKPRKASVK